MSGPTRGESPRDCPKEGGVDVCVYLPDGSERLRVIVDELVTNEACLAESNLSPGWQNFYVNPAALDRILGHLDRTRISYALDNNGAHHNCNYMLVFLAGEGVAPPVEFKPNKRAPFRLDRKHKSLPKLKNPYFSAEDALNDLNAISKVFSDLDQNDQKFALDFMLEIYGDWELDEAKAFIWSAAQGNRSKLMDKSVKAHAHQVALSIDEYD
jgi:hypothetical protein